MSHQTLTDVNFSLSAEWMVKTRTRCGNVVVDECRLIGAGWLLDTDLHDTWVGALDILAGQVQPAGGVRTDGGAVVPQGTPPLPAAPATLELPLCLQTHAAAVSLGCTLVQVHCGTQEAAVRHGH